MQKVQDKRKVVLSLLVIPLVVALDQISKLWVRANSPQIELLPDLLNIVHVENRGAAFGLFDNQTLFLVAVGIISLVVIVLILRYLSPATILSIVSVSLILGGAVGNLIDRISRGSVTDFIEFHVQDVFLWPAFNFADSFVVIGTLTFILSLFQNGFFSKNYKQGYKDGD
jgi:signal peptidase II